MKLQASRLAIAVAIGAALACPTIAIAQTTNVTADFTMSVRTGTPNVFGIVPKTRVSEQDDTFPMLERYGFRMARTTALLEEILPKDTGGTAASRAAFRAAYIQSMNSSPGLNDTGVADPATWNWGDSGPDQNDNFSWQVPHLRDAGMKVYLTIHNMPGWLSYEGTSTDPARNVPSDWDIYRDIVAKVYDRYKADVSWVNIINEPDVGNELVVTGSPYAGQGADIDADRINAYHDMFLNASAAIRAINATVPIGGADLHTDTTRNYMKDLIRSDLIAPASAQGEIPAANYNFYSNHPYGHTYTSNNERASKVLESLAAINASLGLNRTLEVFHSEYNYTFNVASATSENMRGLRNMSWLGVSLSRMMYQPVAGASFYYFVSPNQTIANDTTGEGGFWMYRYVDGQIVANQNMKAFRLASRVLGLGDGPFALKPIVITGSENFPDVYTVAGTVALNAAGERVIYFANFNGTARTVNPIVNDNTFPADTIPDTVEVYLASDTNEGVAPVAVSTVNLAPGQTTLPAVAMPAFSIIGIKVKQGLSSQDFSGDTVGTRPPPGWTYDVSAGGYAEVSSVDGGTTRELRVTDTSTSTKVQIRKALPTTTGRVTVSFRARASQVNQEAGLSVLDSSGAIVATLGFGADGELYGYDGTTRLTNFPTYAADTWHDVRLVIDTNLDVYDAFIGDVQVVDRKPLRASGNVANVARLQINTGNAGAGSFFYDNITVTK